MLQAVAHDVSCRRLQSQLPEGEEEATASRRGRHRAVRKTREKDRWAEQAWRTTTA